VFFGVFCTTKLGGLLPKVEIGLLVIYTVGFFAVLIPIVYLGPHATAKEVFTTFINAGGWSSKTLSFFVGISGNAFTFLGADAMYHVSSAKQL
jgi:choline transport protein